MKIKRRNKKKIHRKSATEKRDTYERRIDACLVIQVAENDFTSNVYTSSYVAILLLCREWNVGYIRPYKIIFMMEQRRKGCIRQFVKQRNIFLYVGREWHDVETF